MPIKHKRAIVSTSARIAIGPVMPGWGSWDWVGSDVGFTLRQRGFQVESWRMQTGIPEADVVIIVKHPPDRRHFDLAANRSRIIFCPVDHYGSVHEIESDSDWLRRCARVLIHCQSLRRFFEPYCVVAYMDHHVKFVEKRTEPWREEGFVLWVGVRSNLPALVEWLKGHSLGRELRILTNFDPPRDVVDPGEVGIDSHHKTQIMQWSPRRHREWAGLAKAAIDIKGDDFRARHKPPAKAIDFIASGLPLAMNIEASAVGHLAELGFDVASPSEPEKWWSKEYHEETMAFGAALRELLSLDRIVNRFQRVIEAAVMEPLR